VPRPSRRSAMNATHNPPLHRFAAATVAATLVLLLAGGLVTSHDAGLAVPDWPLSFGTLLPPMVGGILYEHGHRMIATFVGMLTIVLAVWLWRRDDRPAVRRLGWAALGLVILQGLFGGLTVLFFLPKPVSISHATMAQLFFATVVALALFTSRWWRAPQPRIAHRGGREIPRLALWLVAAVVVQLVLGAAFRHGALGVLPHIAGGAVVMTLALMASAAIRRKYADVRILRGLGRFLASAVGLQIALGIFAWLAVVRTASAPQPMPVMVWSTVIHLAVGAVILGASVILLLVSLRLFAPERVAAFVEPSAPAPRTELAPGRVAG
jgi:heme a synthase